MLFYASLHIVWAKLGQVSAGDTLMMKHAREWVRTSNPVIRNPAHYLWTTGEELDNSQNPLNAL